ncbi:transmembrane protein [Cavenderia fasciculata]|uniref:Transmembrane protein n=1 Tax=Cavenderia fasciculata TaxID=261658 RepID=F4PI04_CACFS|nr:uncharacterized protein DFA_02734 [Cavenderia fasciculata]EGG24491.1 transmembrane protein [Cavenderia fasciculata]|eukprot:XP_004362342.1 transmembrane protein [Cavenderia fasciculata]
MSEQSSQSTRTYPSIDGGWIKDVPRLSKTIGAILGVFLFLGVFFYQYTSPFFALNAARVGPPEFKLWTLFTAGFYDYSIIGGILNIILLMIFGKQFEPIWGSTEFMKFISIVNIFSGLCVFLYFIFYYSITGQSSVLYEANSCGFSGVIAGFTVVLKQLFPEQIIPIFFGVNIRAKHLPSIYVLITLVFMVIGLYSRSSHFVIFGTIVSWIYLRFYQRKGRENVRGDRNESFSFATFFPEPLHNNNNQRLILSP